MSKDRKAPETRPYILLPGRKHTIRGGGGKGLQTLAGGTIVELTESQARSWRDKFVPVDKGFDGIHHPGHAAPPPARVRTPPVAEAETVPDEDAEPVDEPAPDEDAEPDPGLETAAASDVIEAIGTADAVTVTAIREAEEAKARPRKTVLAAADDRLEELVG